MTEPAKKDDFLKSLGVDMDDVKAKLAELKDKGKKLSVEARRDLDNTLKALEPKQKELEVKMGEWAKVGKMAGADVFEGLKRAAKELKKGVEDAAIHLKK